jgi:hypothetical protein
VGPWSPTVLGDYIAGPSHTLPTGGAARSFPGLTVDQFQRRTSVVRYDRASLKRSLATVGEFARLEGLDAHGASAEIRLPGRQAVVLEPSLQGPGVSESPLVSLTGIHDFLIQNSIPSSLCQPH